MQFKPQKVQILTFFEGKILAIFSKRSAILDNFPLQKVKNMGKFFHNFFDGWGKNIFFLAEYSPMLISGRKIMIKYFCSLFALLFFLGFS